MSAQVWTAGLLDVRARIADAWPHNAHEQWQARVLLGAHYPTREGEPEVIAFCQRTKGGQYGLGVRIDLWAPQIDHRNPNVAHVANYPLRPEWARKGWRLNDAGYYRDAGGASELMHDLFYAGCKRLGLEPVNGEPGGPPTWLAKDHRPYVRDIWR